MKKPLLVAGLALLLTIAGAHAQVLNWGSSFVPAWADKNTTGSAPNIDGSGISASVDIRLSGGSFTFANGLSGTISPTVTGATAVVPASTSRMQIGVNFADETNTCTIKYTFTSQVTNLSFRIADIDKLTSASFSYIDMLVIIGSDGVTNYQPTITRYDSITDPNFLVINGNTVYANNVSGQGGNTSSNEIDQRGTVNVDFGENAINAITIVYGNHSSAQIVADAQFIAIGNMSFFTSTLPVEFAYFSGHRQAQDVVLNWRTMHEANARSYRVERNTGTNWETIGTINANGNTTMPSHYTFADINPQGTTLLYRLKQIDIDGSHKYSGIVRITAKNLTNTMACYPNPFSEEINVSINSTANQQVSAILYNLLGKMIRTESRSLTIGNSSLTITGLEGLAKGIYYLEIKDAAGSILGRSSLVKK